MDQENTLIRRKNNFRAKIKILPENEKIIVKLMKDDEIIEGDEICVYTRTKIKQKNF